MLPARDAVSREPRGRVGIRGRAGPGIRARLETADQAPDEAHFFLAVCSQRPLHGSPAFVYLPSSANLLREREKHIGMLQGEVNKRDEWLAAARVELDKFNAVQESAKKTIAQLEQETADKENWARQLDGELAGVRAEREKCIQLLADAEQHVIKRTDWARQLDGELAGVRAEREKCIQLLADAEQHVIKRTTGRGSSMASWRVSAPSGRMHPIARRCRAARDQAHRLARQLDGELAGVRAERRNASNCSPMPSST